MKLNEVLQAFPRRGDYVKTIKGFQQILTGTNGNAQLVNGTVIPISNLRLTTMKHKMERVWIESLP